MKRGIEIRAQDIRPRFGLHAQKQIVFGDAGIVHENVDRLLLDEHSDALANIVSGNVELYAARVMSGADDLVRDLIDALDASCRAEHVRAAVRESSRDGFADPARCASDERGLAAEINAHAQTSRSTLCRKH